MKKTLIIECICFIAFFAGLFVGSPCLFTFLPDSHDVCTYIASDRMNVETKREDLYRQWGPMLLEAIVLANLAEYNRVRAWLEKPLITKQQMMNAIQNELDDLDTYPWMDEEMP